MGEAEGDAEADDLSGRKKADCGNSENAAGEGEARGLNPERTIVPSCPSPSLSGAHRAQDYYLVFWLRSRASSATRASVWRWLWPQTEKFVHQKH